MEFDLVAIMADVRTLIAAWGLKLLGAIAVFIVGRMVAGWARRIVRGALERGNFDATLVPFISKLVYTVLLMLVLLSAAGVLGINTSSFIAILGAAGLAVALAFQGTLSNFSSGIMLLTFRPFHVGDFVEIGGVSGTVKEIGVFVSTLATPDNVRITVPNTKISGEIIKNFSAYETRRIDLVMSVGYDDDLGEAVRICTDVVKADARVLSDPSPVVGVHELGDSSVNLVVRPWVNSPDYWATRWDLTRTLKEKLEAGGLSIPFPQRDVHLFETKSAPAA